MFKALALLKQRGIDVRLAMAGPAISDDYLTSLMDEAERLGVWHQVTYEGILSRDEAIKFQQQASIGLVITLPFGNCVTGLPNRLVESMALGLPVVCSNFPLYQEVAGSTGAGILVDPLRPEQIAEAIEFLVQNPDAARRMGEDGKRAVKERFNWETERVKLLSLYDDVLTRCDYL